MRARKSCLGRVHTAFETQRADDAWHHCLVAVVADAHLDLVCEIDAFDIFEEAVDEMLTRLLAIGDDVDTGVLLLLDGEDGGIALRLIEFRTGGAPWCPQLVGLCEPE